MVGKWQTGPSLARMTKTEFRHMRCYGMHRVKRSRPLNFAGIFCVCCLRAVDVTLRPNHVPGVKLPRFSLLSLLYLIAAVAGYFAFLPSGGRSGNSLVGWISHSYGSLYGNLLYVSGAVAFYVACRFAWRFQEPARLAIAIPITFVPAFIGLIGMVHGYLSVFRLMAVSASYATPGEVQQAHATVLQCLVVGLVLSFVSFSTLAVAMVVKSWDQRSTADDRD